MYTLLVDPTLCFCLLLRDLHVILRLKFSQPDLWPSDKQPCLAIIIVTDNHTGVMLVVFVKKTWLIGHELLLRCLLRRLITGRSAFSFVADRQQSKRYTFWLFVISIHLSGTCCIMTSKDERNPSKVSHCP